MSFNKTRTKLGQTTPKTPPINLIKSGILGTTIACHPSPHPDHIMVETACLSGFSPWSLERGRTEVGRRFGGSRTSFILYNKTLIQKNLKTNEQKKFAFFGKSVAMYKDMDTAHVPPGERELY